MGKRKKPERRRKAKQDRQNLRLWAEGARESILSPHLDGYQKAMDRGWRAERKYWKKICREFHARVDWRTKDHEEPVLRDIDSTQPAVEELLSDEEEAARSSRVNELNARIRRWFVYRVRKVRKVQRRTANDPLKDPYAVLLAKLSGVTVPPKARQAYQQFMRESYTEKIAPRVAEEWQRVLTGDRHASDSDRKSKEPKAGFRAQIAREVFAELSDDERKAYGDRAKAEAAAAKGEYTAALKNPPSQAPADRQRCIDNVGAFIAPILRGVNAATGLHATLILGGPIPEFGGEIRTVHLSYGQNRTAQADHWPQWDKKRFAEVTKFMVDYLGTAFTAEDCARAALGAGVDLANAPYTIPSGGDDNPSDSDSDSDSDDSDSDESSSDDESDVETRPRKKRKVSGEEVSKKRRTLPSHADVDIDGPDPDPEPHPAPSTPSALVPPTSMPAPPPSSSSNALGDEEKDEEMSPPRSVWFLSEGERLANVERNKALLAQLAKPGEPEDPEIARLLEGVRQQLAPLTQELRALVKAPQDVSGGQERETGGKATVKAKRPRAKKKGKEPTAVTRRSARNATGAVTADAEAENRGIGTSEGRDDGAAAAGGNADTLCSDGQVLGDASNTLGEAQNPPGMVSLPPVSQAALLAITPAAPPPASTTPPGGYQECPSGAPKWFVDAHASMTKVDLGIHFHALIFAWTRMEKASRFEHGPTNLSPKLRPALVSSWITRGRRGSDFVVDNPEEYAEMWQRWWDSLQPAWRVRDTDGSWSVTAGYGAGGREWGPLYQWGVNGILSVVASLYFWGRGLTDNEQLRARWEAAVGDVVWMCEGMATYYEMFKGKF
ncbi:hypothetical protein R3P38DRAFT_3224091 [Favolaschia claudopus]|uniref:Uncharacterized protein n=1 Tax=Favolaschia claudopus TaxID=2862362 RepID=A0AAV9ZVU2_9AGAR